MTEPGANEELFSLIIVSAKILFNYLLLPCLLTLIDQSFFGSGFYDGLG